MYSIQYIYICIDVVLLVSEIQIKKNGLHSVNAVQITVFFSFNIKTPNSPSVNASRSFSFYKQSENIQLFDKYATVTLKNCARRR